MRGRARARAVVLVTAVVFGLALASCGPTHHQAVPPAAPTTPPSPTSAPLPAAATTPSPETGSSASAARGYTWARDASPALAIGGGSSSTLAAVVPPSGRTPWTVAGTRLAADGATTATVWTSANGISWRADALTSPQVDSQADAATSWHGGTVVVGSVGPASDRHAAVWISPGAGAPFVERTSPALVAEDSEMTLLSSGPLGLVSAGTAQGRVAMWYSTDGRTWTRLSGAEQVIGAADDPHIDTLLATTDEGVFAAGWDHRGSSIQAALWSSGDGIHWRQVQQAGPQFGGPGDHLITGLAQLQSEPSVSGTGLVAVGGTWTGSRWAPSSWISPNGVSWSQPSTTFALGARPQPDGSDALARAVIAIPSTGLSTTLLAVGGGPTAQRLWKSTDGLHWTEMTLPSAAEESTQWQASQLAVAGSTTIIADGDPGQPQVLVNRVGTGWVQPSANPLVFGAVQPDARPTSLVATPTGVTMAVETDDPGQVIGPGSPSTELLSSADGINWSPVATGTVFGGATVSGLAHTPGGLVAVGWRRTGNTVRAMVWSAPTGRPWAAGSWLDTASPAGSDGASAVCANGREVVAVGWARSSGGVVVARAWSSRDGLPWTAVPVSPSVLPGADEAMTGCSTAVGATTGHATGFEAFGSAASPQTGWQPAFWSSANGRSWTHQNADPFGTGLPSPTLAVVGSAAVWMATTGPPDPDLTSAAPPAASGLWVSTGAGNSWVEVDTSSSVWQGQLTADLDQVALLGTYPVVAGQVDGRLTVWVGVPT